MSDIPEEPLRWLVEMVAALLVVIMMLIDERGEV